MYANCLSNAILSFTMFSYFYQPLYLQPFFSLSLLIPVLCYICIYIFDFYLFVSLRGLDLFFWFSVSRVSFPLPLTKLPLRVYLHAPQLRTHLEDVFHGKKNDFITRNADENIKQTVQWNDLITFSRRCALNIFLCSVAFSFNSTLAHPILFL